MLLNRHIHQQRRHFNSLSISSNASTPAQSSTSSLSSTTSKNLQQATTYSASTMSPNRGGPSVPYTHMSPAQLSVGTQAFQQHQTQASADYYYSQSYHQQQLAAQIYSPGIIFCAKIKLYLNFNRKLVSVRP